MNQDLFSKPLKRFKIIITPGINLEEVEFKVALLGNGGVGKTSLVKRYVYNKFSEKYLKTLGTTVSKKELVLKQGKETIRTKLIIWDIMGQNIFPKVIQGYLKATRGVILVCDLTDKQSLGDLLHWIKLAFDNTDKLAMVFLANKADLGEAAFDYLEFETMAKIYGSPCFKTSALTGDNVETAFYSIGNLILNEQFVEQRIIPKEYEQKKIPEKILAEDEIIATFCEIAGGYQVSMPVIREQFTKADVNFENPSKDGLKKVVENLVRYMSFLSGEKTAKELERDLSKVLRGKEF